MSDEEQKICGGPLHTPRALPEPQAPFDPVSGAEDLARDLAARRTFRGGSGLDAGIVRRLDTSGAPGLHAARLGQRLAPRSLRVVPLDLTVSPYAPPQRQLSAARQGAPMWRPTAEASTPDLDQPALAGPARPAPPPRVAARDSNELPPDLKALLDLHRSRGTI